MIRLAEPAIGEAQCEAVCRVLRSGRLVQGEVVQAFERALAEYAGSAYAAAVSSGTAALWVALRAVGVKPGDAVIAPAFTFPATVNVIELSGAHPVLVDVDPHTYCMDPDGVARAIRRYRGPGRLAAIMPVHEFGAPCQMDAIMDLSAAAGLVVVEDAACALGTTFGGQQVGTFGQAGCLSFHPRKALTTGEGGAVVSNDETVDHAIRMLRNHGLTPGPEAPYDLLTPGLNWRMTDFQAALGLSQLESFSATLRARESAACTYLQELADTSLILPRHVPGHAWQTFMVVLPEDQDRASLIARLRQHDIEAGIGAYAIHLLTYYAKRYHLRPDDFPVARMLHERGLALPLHAGLDGSQVRRVASAVTDALQH